MYLNGRLHKQAVSNDNSFRVLSVVSTVYCNNNPRAILAYHGIKSYSNYIRRHTLPTLTALNIKYIILLNG